MAIVEDSNQREKMELSFDIDKEKKITEVLGNYLEKHPTCYDTNVTTWHKPFGEIFREASQAGFILDKLLDPKPLEEMKAVAPHHYQKLLKIPDFGVIRLLKQHKAW